MIQSSNKTDFLHLLGADEKVLWQGPISFNFFSSPVVTGVLALVTTFTIWALAEYEPSQSASPRQAFGNLAIRPALILILFFQILAMLERRALSLGRASGQIILTDHRLLRICAWPKLRVRAADYQSKRVSGFGGIIWVGELGWFTLAPSDAAQVRSLIKSRKTEAVA